ncbi:hypothetical protein Aperf_G00000013269 [Anoplocephala perfoliata]
MASKIKVNEQERSRDPIEIFDELDRKRAEGELRPELIDTADPHSMQESRRPSLASDETLPKKSSLPSHSRSPTPSVSPTPSPSSSHSASTDFHPKKVTKRKLPTVCQNNISRRLPQITKIQERSTPAFSKRKNVKKSPASIPILRSHRILPGNSTHRRLPTLVSIIENPQIRDHYPILPSPQVKKILPSMIKEGSHKDRIFPNSFPAVKSNLMAPRHPLIRTETETTYLTSSLGDTHQVT